MSPPGRVLPQQFLDNITSIAKASRQHIVLAEGDDPRVSKAAGELLRRGLCDLTILGTPNIIRGHAKNAGVSIEGAAIIDPATAPVDDMVRALCEARSKSGMTPETAAKLVRDRVWYGTMMMFLGRADGMVCGADTNTADTFRPALQIIKAAPGVSQVSSYFLMLLEDGVLVYADCGLVVDPTAPELAEIALHTARSARSLGIEPKIAMLSYVTSATDKQAQTAKTREATQIAKERAPQELIEGPIQFDAAIHPDVAAQKFKAGNNPVAGKATVLVFPDLNAGNICYKATQHAGKCIAIGPVAQGFNKPVNDLSRGCSVEDIVYCAVVTSLQSLESKRSAPHAKL